MDMLLAETEIKINGQVIEVKKFPMLAGIRLTARVSKLVNKVLGDEESVNQFNTAVNALVADGSTQAETNGFRLFGIKTLLSLLGDDLVDVITYVISKSTNLTNEEIEAINLEEGLDLLFEIFNVNKGFFTKFSTKLKALGTEAKKETKKKKA